MPCYRDSSLVEEKYSVCVYFFKKTHHLLSCLFSAHNNLVPRLRALYYFMLYVILKIDLKFIGSHYKKDLHPLDSDIKSCKIKYMFEKVVVFVF